jgi:hypothetical protein
MEGQGSRQLVGTRPQFATFDARVAARAAAATDFSQEHLRRGAVFRLEALGA